MQQQNAKIFDSNFFMKHPTTLFKLRQKNIKFQKALLNHEFQQQ